MGRLDTRNRMSLDGFFEGAGQLNESVAGAAAQNQSWTR